MLEHLSPFLILTVIAAYFGLLILMAHWTGRSADNEDFFIAGRKSPWLLVAIGMIGASLSGVTFISVPGKVGSTGLNQSFSYMQVVFGYLLGYLVIGTILMPLYYRRNLTSIYTFLDQRLGNRSYKTGAAFFLLSRTIQASFRLYLVAIILHQFVLADFGVPFYLTVIATIALIWVYTYRGGIKTIVWTDMLQTICMLLAVVLTIFAIGDELGQSFVEMTRSIQSSPMGQLFFFEGGWSDPNNFFKQFFSGALIAIVMTGLDQDMMQKNLSCRNIGEAQKNMLTFSIILVFVNLLFLMLGALLYFYAAKEQVNIPERTDELYPLIALTELSPAIGILFILGLIAAAYSSADSALTALTTSFCVDFLAFEKTDQTEAWKRSKRRQVHLGFSALLVIVILIFSALNNQAVINQLFIAAGYTYGPILGLFVFGLISKRAVKDRWVPIICLAAPVISYLVNSFSEKLFNGFQFGFLILALNGLLTLVGLYLLSYQGENSTVKK